MIYHYEFTHNNQVIHRGFSDCVDDAYPASEKDWLQYTAEENPTLMAYLLLVCLGFPGPLNEFFDTLPNFQDGKGIVGKVIESGKLRLEGLGHTFELDYWTDIERTNRVDVIRHALAKTQQ